MFRWLLIIFLVLILFSSFLPWLEKLGVGQLPGDVRFSLFGKKIFLELFVKVTKDWRNNDMNLKHFGY